jgi:type II secretory pathway component PulF
MFGYSRISTKQLAGLCRRLSISLEAGIDIRTALAREAERAQGATAQRHLTALREAIHGGASVHDALEETGEYFPELFRAILHVGEKSGHTGEALGQLAGHYEGQIRLRRRFLTSITMPLVELAVSVVVIGLLIWFLGFIGRSSGTTFDVLGLGLVGNRGLVIYVVFVAAVAIAIFSVIQGIRRGGAWTKPVQRAMIRVPGIGRPLETIALARLAWAMHLTFDAGIDVRSALRLSLESTRNAHFTDQVASIDQAVEAGQSLHEAFAQTAAFPVDFLDSLHAAEESGRLVEAMGRLSGQYQEQAEAAMHVFTVLAGFAVWALIAVIITIAIFRVFSFYVGQIQSLT